MFRVERIKHFWSNFIPISFVRMPDRTFTWIPSAYRIARHILNTKDVDIIFTSSPPPSASILGSFLQRKTGLPWVAEFRDLWSLNSLEKRILIIDLAERLIERQVLKNAAALVTVSEKLRHHLELLHKKPTYVVYNGFDPEDFADNIPLLKEFTITYTGSLSSKRDPSPLFHALSILRKSGYISKDFFRLRFIGTRYEEYITNLAKYYKIEDMVEVYGRVNYKRSIRAQKESTLLLLLEGMDPESKGVLTGKIFEYIASGRPVLAICHERGEIAQLLQKCRIGAVVNQPSQIATFLIKCLNRFRQGDFYFGFHVNQQEIDRYSRKNQSDTLANIFQKLTNGDI
ncbi:glycosyltransferase [Candidatus Sumerlaeota bacterium]|nr:glycosyltransferase [Candidatus Sumerlaeota bacterium]